MPNKKCYFRSPAKWFSIRYSCWKKSEETATPSKSPKVSKRKLKKRNCRHVTDNMKIQTDRSTASINFFKTPIDKTSQHTGLFVSRIIVANKTLACHSLRIITAASRASKLRRLTPVRRLTRLVEQAGEEILELRMSYKPSSVYVAKP